MTGVGLRPTWKRVELPPNPKRCARLISIPITGNFGSGWSHGTDREEAKRIFDGSVEAGGERELLDFPATPVAEVLSL